MATSLLMGLADKGFAVERLRASDPSEERRKLLAAAGINVFESNAEAISGADVILIAVKPQVVQAVVRELAEVVREQQLVISIAAGVPISALQLWVGKAVGIIRCMPNTPALKGAGMTGMYQNDLVTDGQSKLGESILSAAGEILWLESEAQLDAVTAISGSGPAYYFYLTEALISAGQELGLSAATSEFLARQTAHGASVMLRESSETASTLRVQVTSPGGTTEAALNSLQEHGVADAINRAVKAAANRSAELGASLSGPTSDN